MKKPDLNIQKLLLILLGVLVAIIIGYHSKAIGRTTLSYKNNPFQSVDYRINAHAGKLIDWVDTLARN